MMARAAVRGPSAAQSISIAPDDDTVSVVQGGTVQIVYTLTRVGGYSGTVTPAVTGLPSGVSGAWSDSSLTGGDTTTTLTLTATGGATEVTNDAFTVTFSGAGVSDAVDAGTVTVTASGSYDLAAEVHRWASGTGSTLVSCGVTFQDNQVLAANVGNVSVFVNGVAMTRFAVVTAVHPLNPTYANVIYFQFTVTATNGTPIAAGINFDDVANVTTTTWTDDSAAWTNTNSTTWRSSGAGLPAGVIVPTSAAHLCAASPFGKLIPKATQPSFTGSTAVDTALDGSITGTVQAWGGTQSWTAAYEHGIALIQHHYRTADAAHLKDAFAFMARYNTLYLYALYSAVPATAPAEQEQGFYSIGAMYFLRYNTVALDGLKKYASDIYLNGSSGVGVRWDGGESPRFMAGMIKSLVVCLRAGLGSTQNNYSSGTFDQMAQAVFVQAIVSGSTKLLQTDGTLTLSGFASNGTTASRTMLIYQAGIYLMPLIHLTEITASSSNRTAAVAQISASILQIRTGGYSGTSAGGSRSYQYQTVDNYYDAVPGVLTAGYTSGSTSMSIDIDSPRGVGTGWDVSTTFSPGSRIGIAGTTKAITAGFTTNGSGQATVTLEAGGFGSNYSSSQAITFIRDSAVGVSYENVDLNGFLAPLFAWRANNNASSADADEARTIFATIGETPQDGSNGPFITAIKQWSESFNDLFCTMYYLNASGL